MRGIRFLVVFMVLSASLLCTAEAGRGRTSNQNSFRRAANGIYQTLSSVFGEDNIRGLYKVSVGLGCSKEQGRAAEAGWGLSMANRKWAPGPDQQFHGCHFEKKKKAIILYFNQSVGYFMFYDFSVKANTWHVSVDVYVTSTCMRHRFIHCICQRVHLLSLHRWHVPQLVSAITTIFFCRLNFFISRKLRFRRKRINSHALPDVLTPVLFPACSRQSKPRWHTWWLFWLHTS